MRMDLSDPDTRSIGSADGSPTRKSKKKKFGLIRHKKVEKKEELYFRTEGTESEVHLQQSHMEVSTNTLVKTTGKQSTGEQLGNGMSFSHYKVSETITAKKIASSKKPCAPLATHELDVVLLSGENLAVRDANGYSDPYVKFKVNNKTVYKSQCCKMTLDPRWNEHFVIELNEWANISVHVFDWDRYFKNDFMGCAPIDLTSLSKSPSDVTLKLEDDDTEEDLGYLHLTLALRPIEGRNVDLTETDSAPNPIENVASFKRANTFSTVAFDRESKCSIRPRRDTSPTEINSQKLKLTHSSGSLRRSQPVAVATVQLVSGHNLPARDANGFSDPYVKMQLGKIKKKSKVCYKTLNPVWKDEFTFQLYKDDRSLLDLGVWDRDKYRNDDFIGRCDLDVWSLEHDRTHSLSLELVDTQGSILLLVTVHKTAPDQVNKTPFDLSELRQKYKTAATFKELGDVGLAEIRVVSASNLRSADLNGKSDPFCVVQLCNARAQTQTCYKTLDPVWNRVFTFPVKDIHNCFEILIFDQDKDTEREFLGRVSIPILRACNGQERRYALKDRKLKNRVKGEVTVQISYIYNPVRAAIRTFSPSEERHMQESVKFKKQLLVHNFQRVWRIVQSLIATAEFVNSCFTWENPRRTAFAFVTFLLMTWNFELYMFPILLLLLFAKNYVDIFVRETRLPRHEEIEENARPDEDEDDEDKKSFMQKLNAIQEVLTKVQNVLDAIASFGERIYNTFLWSVPFLSCLAFIVLMVASVILYYVPLRAIVLLWGVNKFTKRLRNPNYVPNNELMDFLSRIPSNVEIDEFREPKERQESPRNAKKKK